MRPSMAANWHQNDQLPFLARTRFSALPQFRVTHIHDNEEKLSLFIAVLYVIDMFGAFPFIILPGLLVQLGFFGIPLVISVLVLQIYTSFLLSQCWIMAEELDPSIVHKSRYPPRYPYAAIANLAYGRYASFFVTILLDLSIFAGGIPNIIMAAENLEMLMLGNSISEIGIVLAPLTWLGSPKRMRGLAVFSVCVIVFIVLLLWFCLFSATPWGSPFQGINFVLPPLSKLLKTYCILVFQFDIHSMLLTLQIDMQQKQLVGWAAFIGIAGYKEREDQTKDHKFNSSDSFLEFGELEIIFALSTSSALIGIYQVLSFNFLSAPRAIKRIFNVNEVLKQHMSLPIFGCFPRKKYYLFLSGNDVTCTLAMTGSIIAAYKFGTMIGENVLRILPASVPLYTTSILMSLQLCFSVTANSSAMFLQLENYFKISENFSMKRMAIRSTVVIFQVIISEFVPSFDALMDIVGGTITGPLVFIMPTLLYRRLVRMECLHHRIVTEASYGSIALDLNYDPMEDLSPQLLTDEKMKTQSMLHACWQQAIYIFVRLQCDLSLSMLVLLFGVLVTFFATYLNIFELTTLFQNNSPCFGNFSAFNKT
uniref:Amino acid transporter transmembrane domain-containing protein n=1 Tax=Glossina brevipalpis TaxID=37001 RepID=A0A1A9X1U2_9MUSC